MILHMSSIVFHWLMAANGAGTTILDGAQKACGTSCGNPDLNVVFKNAANVLTYLIGAASVLMVIYGGFRYVISRGDAAQIKVAKETILYAVVGVIVSLVAFAVIKFVATTIGK